MDGLSSRGPCLEKCLNPTGHCITHHITSAQPASQPAGHPLNVHCSQPTDSVHRFLLYVCANTSTGTLQRWFCFFPLCVLVEGVPVMPVNYPFGPAVWNRSSLLKLLPVAYIGTLHNTVISRDGINESHHRSLWRSHWTIAERQMCQNPIPPLVVGWVPTSDTA